jgi:hypothetical protein
MATVYGSPKLSEEGGGLSNLATLAAGVLSKTAGVGDSTLATTSFPAGRVGFGHASDGSLTHSAELTYATATGTFDVAKARSGGTVTSSARNTSNAASSDARLWAEVAGASGGDPSVRLSVASVVDWDLLVANATNDEFRINVGGAPMFRMLTTGQSTLGGNLAPDADYVLTLYSGVANQALKQKLRGSGVSSRAILELAPDGGNGFIEFLGNGASLAGLVQGQTAAALGGLAAGGDIDRLMLGIAGNKSLILVTNSTLRLTVDGLGNVVLGTAALATTATDGFLSISSSAGAPTGVPTAQAGRAQIHYDSTNSKIYVCFAGTWKSTAALA